MKDFDPVWDYDYFKKALTVVLATLLSVFAFVLPKGDAVVAPAGETSSVLTQTAVVTGSHARDLQMTAFWQHAETGFVIPGLAEGLIPQGICYDEANEVYLISGYYEDDTPSRICVVGRDGALQKSVGLITPGGKAIKACETVYTTKGGHKLYARADGYVLDETAPYGFREENVVDGVAYPDKAIAIPPEVQGMTFTPDGKLVFSCSYGRTVRSLVSVYADVTQRKADETQTFGDALVPLVHCRLIDRKATYTAPPMLQECCVGPDGRLCFLSEAGATKYRCGGGLDPYDEVIFWQP